MRTHLWDQSINVPTDEGVTRAGLFLEPLLVQQLNPASAGMDKAISLKFCGNL